MSKVRVCDACGKSATERRMYEDETFISVEADAHDDCFDACSWACVAELALSKATSNVT